MKTLITSTRVPHLVIATILGPLAFGCATVCLAGDTGDVPQAVVKFTDLNLSTPDAAAALYGRIRLAAYDVCASFDTDMRDLPDPAGLNTCVHNAVRDAVAKVNQSALSAIYNARNRDPLPTALATAQNR